MYLIFQFFFEDSAWTSLFNDLFDALASQFVIKPALFLKLTYLPLLRVCCIVKHCRHSALQRPKWPIWFLSDHFACVNLFSVVRRLTFIVQDSDFHRFRAFLAFFVGTLLVLSLWILDFDPVWLFDINETRLLACLPLPSVFHTKKPSQKVKQRSSFGFCDSWICRHKSTLPYCPTP